MRILHAPHNIGGTASIAAKAQKQLGVQSDVLVFGKYYNYPSDFVLNIPSKGFVRRLLTLISNFVKAAIKYDVFHFYFGDSLLPTRLLLPWSVQRLLPITSRIVNPDIVLLRLLRKKVIMQYCGDDVRQYDTALRYTFRGEIRKIYPSTKAQNDSKRERIRRINFWVNMSIIGDYFLAPYTHNSVVVMKPIDLSEMPFVGARSEPGRLVVIHAPTDRGIKGTDFVVQAVDRLKKSGRDIDFVLLENRPHEDVLEACKKADIVVEQVIMESYGQFAVECMALGKPVLSRVDETFAPLYRNLPIVRTDPSNLLRDLERLIRHPRLRMELGEQGRRYVEEVHDARKIARQLLMLYQKA